MAVGLTILVVAPDPAFRQSLGFVLEAEGCSVRLAGRLPQEGTPLDGFDCLVIDDRSLKEMMGGLAGLEALGRPVVLLVDRLDEFGPVPGMRMVEKPLLGHMLVESVCDAARHPAMPSSAVNT